MFGTMLELVVYVLVGIVVMLAGYFLIDFIVPCDFPKELKDGNKAVGWVSAGIYIGLGTIIHFAIKTLTIANKAPELINGVLDTVVYSVAGIVFFIAAYFLIDIVNKKYNFNVELEARNEAIGITVFGIFIGIALIVGGVIA
ncbi:DUF350 domain-containing protein [Peptostreptococcus equinus]|uniref:DUF350 domain-containing protein n=1 Tax=Peptostreptococcus equinus TaxID=3003601 RepID=A0ABY7JQK0_9FIRM|nr:DUF350 domain-containing protein [Peptostreptococcus sp. CBA3647]WAW15395.1 DUF350 domain-containing protein [Peptostreptococcus sp. CBA3647]